MNKTYHPDRCLEAERAAVGCSLISSQVLPAVRSYLAKERFYNIALGGIFEAICSLADRKLPLDVVTVGEELRRRGTYDSFGGGETLRALIDAVAFADHGEYYAKIAAGYFYEREIIRAAGEVSVAQTPESLEVLGKLVLAREQLGLPKVFSYEKDLYDVLDTILAARKGDRSETGFPSFDRTFGGLMPGEVVTWGAATNKGKSIILLNVASHCASRQESVLYVGTEMSAADTVARHLSILTGIPPQRIRAGLPAAEVQRLQETLGERMQPMPMRILDLPEPSLSDVEAALTASRARVVFLDYLERFKLPPGDNFRLRVNDFMRRVKNLARRYDCVVHLASQLSRATYGAVESQPTLAHLSESSAIEKESDRVLLIWEPNEKNNGVNAGFGDRTLEIVLAKNRHGRRGLALDVVLEEKSLRVFEKNAQPQEEMYR